MLAFALSNLCAVRLSNTGAAFLLCVPLALLLFYGAAFYLYRQHKKRAAHEEKLAKQKIITGEAPPIEAAD